MPVGELFLSAFLQVLFDRLASPELLDYARQLKGGVFKELQKWEKKLNLIQDLLNDAEENQLTKGAVKTWLDDLRDLAYDVEDILDEFAYEVLQRKLVAEHQTTSSKVLNFIPSSYTSLRFKDRLASNIKEITKRLEELYGQRSDLGLQVLPQGRSSTVAPVPQGPTSVPTEPAVYGREEDKAKILQMVLRDEPSISNFRVISIVGMGGIGKTTLAREVYNDKSVGDFQFNIRAWACVSDDFDVLRISKALLESITSSSNSSNDLNEVQVQLSNAVNGKKFLMVLDDVWNKNYGSWEMLKAPFLASAPGSKLIVTTRHADVASTMGSIEHYNLKLLSDDDCWSLFVKHAFEDGVDISPAQQHMAFIHKKVVQMCKGLPLAARALGGLLRSKSRDNEWENILNSQICDLEEDENEILPVLKLSYHHLPKHLKRCFAYCAIFPKDYEFDEKEIVLLWMAEGFIQQSSNGTEKLENSGCKYFRDLLSRSLFQQSTSNSSRFVMHDLIHDLAQLVSKDTIFKFEETNQQKIRFERIRHASYISEVYNSKNKFEVFQKFDQLRTLVALDTGKYSFSYYIPNINIVVSDFMQKLRRLRVLSLINYHITQVSDALGGLRHLRYLNLSCTKIRNLPESTSLLFNLQTLLLKDCCRLIKLPSKLKDLNNMYHLDISGRNLLKEMPFGMKELRNLHILSNFIVGKGSGSGMEDLKNLEFLEGELCISGLENILDLRVTKGKILCHHEGLEKLSLNWCSKFDDSRNEEIEENVIDMLQPHENIKELSIEYYGGKRFPSWLGHPLFSKIVVISMVNCEECEKLPSLGLLGSLKKLSIKGMKGLKSLGLEIYGEDCLKPFPLLESLYFENLAEWMRWEPMKENKHVVSFPCLRELSIVGCPKLTGRLPDYLTSLETLVVRKCPQLVFESSNFPLLCKMEIDEYKGIECSSINPLDLKSVHSMTLSKVSEMGNWSKQWFQNVEFLKIDGCEGLIYSWKSVTCSVEKPLRGMHRLNSLKGLTIENCSSLDLFPEADFLPCLTSLKIINCLSLKSLPERRKDNDACLQELDIDGCNSLTFIARGMLPSSLKRLSVSNCEKLQCVVDDKDDTIAPSSSSSASMMPKKNFSVSLLERLYIRNCLSLTCISCRGQLPMSLQYLNIYDCPELESIAVRFDNSTCLKEIDLVHCEKLKSITEGLHHLSVVSFPERGLPNSTDLSVYIEDCEKLEALPNCMHNLWYLNVLKCPSMISFPKGLPTNLTTLFIDGDLKIYKPLIEWALHNLTSLKHLGIFSGGDAVRFPQKEMEMILPTSLTSLAIANFPKLKYLSSTAFQNLTALGSLYISDCPKLASFPKVGLPSSLLKLDILGCPLLAKQYKNHKGKEWYKIAHIPCVQIDLISVNDSD